MEMEHPTAGEILAIFRRVREAYFERTDGKPESLDMPLRVYKGLEFKGSVAGEFIDGVESFLGITIPEAEVKALPGDPTVRDFYTLVASHVKLPRITSVEEAWPALLAELRRRGPKVAWPSADALLEPVAARNHDELQRAVIVLSRGRMHLPQPIYPRWSSITAAVGMTGFAAGGITFLALAIGGVKAPLPILAAWGFAGVGMMISVLGPRLAVRRGEVHIHAPWKTLGELAAAIFATLRPPS